MENKTNEKEKHYDKLFGISSELLPLNKIISSGKNIFIYLFDCAESKLPHVGCFSCGMLTLSSLTRD